MLLPRDVAKIKADKASGQLIAFRKKFSVGAVCTVNKK